MRRLFLVFMCLAGVVTPVRAVTFAPGWERVQNALTHAVSSPAFWVPLAAAGIAYAGGWDTGITEWASTRAPVFGSAENARRFSDYFAAGASVLNWGTVPFVPTDTDSGSWLVQKLEHAGVIIGANSLNFAVTASLKNATHRERPDASGFNSFPSGHASYTTVNAVLAEKNLQLMPVSGTGKRIADVTLVTCVAGASWARIEGDKHYLTDVLVGVALGYFIGDFFGTAFIGDPRADVSLAANMVSVKVPFR